MKTGFEPRIRTTLVLGAALAVASLGACASQPKPRPATLDPSNPAAPEAARLEVAAPATPREKPAATVYTCPMHPEVTSDKPGSCPKCGMELVPQAPAQGKQ